MGHLFTLVELFLALIVQPLAIAILICGLDDLVLHAVCLYGWLFRPAPGATPPVSQPEKRLAVFVPCWKEAEVIGKMIEHNVAAIDYGAYDIFVGAYPNDEPTLTAVRELAARFPRLHLATCPHDGPTSKADCLNWIYQHMLEFEDQRGTRFDIVVTHDAEDIIHPESFRTINHYSATYDMVQIPVLPLRMPWWHATHGVYCDEFAEFQCKDMGARGIMRSFIPSCGVGTGFSRQALERLATNEGNRIFEPSCLTEDYENGMRLHLMGCSQIFVPLKRARHGFVCTREYFPPTRSKAIRQRTRWVTGIALQTWERHGWKGNLSHVYWLWRDRRGLITNPLGLIVNLASFACLVTWAHAQSTRTPWSLPPSAIHPALLFSTSILAAFHIAVRMSAVTYVYDFRLALGVPLRMVWANYINAAAACRALFTYGRAKLGNQPLVWVKTEHNYPSRARLLPHKRTLGEVLVGSGYVSAEQLASAVAAKPRGLRIGEYLVLLGLLTEDELYEALSLQHSLPLNALDPIHIPRHVARSLPRHVVERWKVLPFRAESGSLFVASPEIPSEEAQRVLRSFTGMALRFHLVTPTNFRRLAQALR